MYQVVFKIKVKSNEKIYIYIYYEKAFIRIKWECHKGKFLSTGL